MGEVIHTSRIKIVRENGPTRKAIIEGLNEPVYYGVHGGIKKFYKIEPEKEHAATLDHIIAATGACMMGTFSTLLARDKISTSEDRYHADVEGDVENADGVLKITRIRVQYHLKIHTEKVPEAKTAFSSYLQFCPAVQSIKGCIEIKDNLVLEHIEPI